MKRALAERAKQSVRREVKHPKIDPSSSSSAGVSGGGVGSRAPNNSNLNSVVEQQEQQQQQKQHLQPSPPISRKNQFQSSSAGGAQQPEGGGPLVRDAKDIDADPSSSSALRASPTSSPPSKIPRVATTVAPLPDDPSTSSGTGVSRPSSQAAPEGGPSSQQHQPRSSEELVPVPAVPSSSAVGDHKDTADPDAAPSSSSPPLIKRRPSATVTSAPPASSSFTTAPSGGGGQHHQHHRAGQKRQRSLTGGAGASVDDSDLRDVPDDASAFYLRHQNRALAVEWQSLNAQVQQLTRERDERRQDCWAATQALQSLQATWTQLESAVVMLGSSTSAATSSSPPPGAPATSSSAVPSTGGGESVEWTRALSGALEALANHQNHTTNRRHAEPASEGGGGDNRSGDGRPESDEDGAAAGKGTRALAPGLEDAGSLRADWSSQCAANLATRAAALQEHLLPRLLLSATAGSSQQQREGADSFESSTRKLLEENAKLQQQVQQNAARCLLLERHVSELAQSRDDALQSERRIRRNVLRLSAGMMTSEQVVQAMETSDSGGGGGINDDEEEFRELLKQNKEQQALLQSLRAAEASASGTGAVGTSEGLSKVKLEGEDGGDSGASSAAADNVLTASQKQQLQVLQSKVSDLEQSVSNRDESLQKLDAELKEKEKRISELSVKQRSDDDDRKLEGYEAVKKRLELAQGSITKLEGDVEKANARWATARSNEETVTEALREQHSKYEKRWKEIGEALMSLSGSGQSAWAASEQGEAVASAVEDSNKPASKSSGAADDDKQNGSDDDKSDSAVKRLLDSAVVGQSKQIAEMQHKLHQALENVRQAEMTRMELKDALDMNESLRSKLDELKSKYSNLRSSAGQSSSAPSSSKAQQSSSADADASASTREAGASGGTTNASSSSSSDRVEKLHRENRRMRKEMSAVVASKESAKAKLERAEKERDSLMESNARLLKQITEKDDMNAKSLSTILHLKSMTEQLSHERDNLEQQAKSASQLALAARLSSNAKERLSDEVEKEKKVLERRVKDLESKFATTKAQLDKITVEWSEASAKTTTLNGELSNALKRIDDLIADLEKKNGEIRKLTDSVSMAEREAREARERVETLSKRRRTSGSGGNDPSSVDASSGFTVEQLTTQVSVLKNRLACPVCHYRDKECIIMRCRHMHCKQCVEERITNRSRKCPTCNNRFSDKDVEDIWLK